MVLTIPETGLQLESSAKSAESLPLQAFAITLSDNVIEDLIQCAQKEGNLKLSLGSTPSFLFDRGFHKISKASEIPNLDLYITDPSEPIPQRLPHPTMSLFAKPELDRFPKLAAGRGVVKEKNTSTKTSAAGRRPRKDVPDDVARLKADMAQARSDKLENGTKIVSTSLTGARRGTTKGSHRNLLSSTRGSTVTGTVSRSGAASPALSLGGSPSLAPTLSATEQATEKAKELRAPIVHELAVKEKSFEELRSRWPGDEKNFKTALDKVADFKNDLQKFVMKKMYWKELDVFKYDYDSDEERQTAIDNAIRMYDRMRVGTSEPEWQRLLPKEERGKGKCLSKLQATIAKSTAQASNKTPQIKVHDAEDSSGTQNGDAIQSGVDKKPKKKGGEPMSRSSSQTKLPAKKVEKKPLPQKKAATHKVSPAKAGAKTSKDKGGRVLSKEFVSDSDSSSEEAPLSTTVPRSKAVEKEREARLKATDKEREEREKARERELEKEKPVQKPKAKEAPAPAPAPAPKPKPKPAAPKEIIKPQVVARPVAQKRSREEPDDDSSSSGTPLSKRVNQEIKAAAASHSSVSYKRPPSDTSSQSSSRSSSYGFNSYSSKNKNTSPVKSSPLASSPPTNASDLQQLRADEVRRERERERERAHDRSRDRSRDRSVTVATTNGNINVKKRKADADRDVIDVAVAEKKRARLSTNVLDEARKFKRYYEVYQGLHYELQGKNNFSQDKYNRLLQMRDRLENLKSSIYSQIPQEY